MHFFDSRYVEVYGKKILKFSLIYIYIFVTNRTICICLNMHMVNNIIIKDEKIKICISIIYVVVSWKFEVTNIFHRIRKEFIRIVKIIIIIKKLQSTFPNSLIPIQK